MVAQSSNRFDAGILSALFPESDVPRRIGRAFDLMRVAEEEIAAAKLSAPRKRKTLHALFKAMYPGELLAYPDAVYRSHCRELIGRAKRGEDLAPGTDAEVLVMMSKASLAAPLASEFAHAMSTVFRRVFPDAPEDLAAGAEAWSGRTEEIIAEARRKLARERE